MRQLQKDLEDLLVALILDTSYAIWYLKTKDKIM